MLYHLMVSLSDQVSALNVFRYITFRTGGAVMTALLFVFLFGPGLISMLRLKQGRGQPIRIDGRIAICSRSRARPPWAAW
jgi:phospho-N-acetylmuramoyl-pentapeptide-transferase